MSRAQPAKQCLGSLAIIKGYATPRQIDAAVMQQEANHGTRIGQVLVERRVITPDQLDELLDVQGKIDAGEIEPLSNLFLERAEAPEPDAPAPPPRVLFVDDEPRILTVVERVLRREPYQLLTALSGTAALTILDHVPLDVVLADEHMPGMTGSELLHVVRRRQPEAARILLTGEVGAVGGVAAPGTIECRVNKPFDRAELIELIGRAVDSRQAP